MDLNNRKMTNHSPSTAICNYFELVSKLTLAPVVVKLIQYLIIILIRLSILKKRYQHLNTLAYHNRETYDETCGFKQTIF